jgi:hypothetical protein
MFIRVFDLRCDMDGFGLGHAPDVNIKACNAIDDRIYDCIQKNFIYLVSCFTNDSLNEHQKPSISDK